MTVRAAGAVSFVRGLPAGAFFPVLFAAAAFTLLVPVFLGRAVDFLERRLMAAVCRVSGRNAACLVFNRLTFPGVVLHESAHAFLAFLTGAHVERVRFAEFSRRRLGHVDCVLRGNRIQRMAQSFFVSCAPVVLGFPCEWFLFSAYRACGGWRKAFTAYLMFCVTCHMSMSPEDVRGYLKGCPAMFLFLSLLFLTAFRLF